MRIRQDEGLSTISPVVVEAEAEALVTGVSGGVGREVARGLAGKGARVVLAARSADRGQAVH